jgi:hypothetical protein
LRDWVGFEASKELRVDHGTKKLERIAAHWEWTLSSEGRQNAYHTLRAKQKPLKV